MAIKVYLETIYGDLPEHVIDRAKVTRIDFIYDYPNARLTDFHFYMKRQYIADPTPYNHDLQSIRIGSKASMYPVTYTNRGLELSKLTGDKKWLEIPMVRATMTCTKKMALENIFTLKYPHKRVLTFQFNHTDSLFKKNFVNYSDTDKDVRARIIELLDNTTLFHTLRRYPEHIDTVLKALAPYQIDMHSKGTKWELQRDQALSPLKILTSST